MSNINSHAPIKQSKTMTILTNTTATEHTPKQHRRRTQNIYQIYSKDVAHCAEIRMITKMIKKDYRAF